MAMAMAMAMANNKSFFTSYGHTGVTKTEDTGANELKHEEVSVM